MSSAIENASGASFNTEARSLGLTADTPEAERANGQSWPNREEKAADQDALCTVNLHGPVDDFRHHGGDDGLGLYALN